MFDNVNLEIELVKRNAPKKESAKLIVKDIDGHEITWPVQNVQDFDHKRVMKMFEIVGALEKSKKQLKGAMDTDTITPIVQSRIRAFLKNEPEFYIASKAWN